jgi:membrane protein
MKSIKEKLAAFQRSYAGLFFKKVMNDQAPNLAALLAWGTLSSILPLMLGILTVAGFVLRDPVRLNQVFDTVTTLVPAQAMDILSSALEGVRRGAGGAGIIAILLLLFNGSAFFGNMASVFDQAYHVESRNFVMQRVVSIVMLIVTTALLVVTTLSLGLGSLIGNMNLGLPIGPVVGRSVSWSLSILSAFLLFLLLYKVLPNAGQGWRNVLPGTLLSAVLFFVILLVFPIYIGLFPPNQAYAVFGVFLVFTFWLYLLGWVFVLGAELNAFLQEPARASALAEATAKAEKGQATYDQQTGEVRAESSGEAPALRGAGTLGAPSKSAADQMHEQGESANSSKEQPERQGATKPSLAGRILGFIGLIFAVMMLRGGTQKETQPTA